MHIFDYGKKGVKGKVLFVFSKD